MLGRLGTANAVDLLCREAESERETRAAIAIRALSCYGDVPCKEGFLLFGGTLRWVVLPATPSQKTTATLCRMIPPPVTPLAEKSVEAIRERSSAWISLVYEVVRALEAHRGPVVVEAAIDTLLTEGLFARDMTVHEDLIALLVRGAAHVGEQHRARLREAAQHAPRGWMKEVASKALAALERPEVKEVDEPGIYVPAPRRARGVDRPAPGRCGTRRPYATGRPSR